MIEEWWLTPANIQDFTAALRFATKDELREARDDLIIMTVNEGKQKYLGILLDERFAAIIKRILEMGK